MNRLWLALSFLLIVAGCSKKHPTNSGPVPFMVVVYDQDHKPVPGATVTGGIDWDYFKVLTDSSGIAWLPGTARNYSATISKTDFFPLLVSPIAPSSYTLNPTPKRVVCIGDVVGEATRFGNGSLVTVEYGGAYHVYAYNDQSVTQTASAQLPSCIKEMQLRGDTLWFSTHDAGIYVYSIQNASSPQLLFHLPISGTLWPFAVKDSFVIVGDFWEPGPVRIFRYYPDGQIQERSRIGNYFVRKLAVQGNALFLVGNSEALPTVFDISDPGSPRLLYNGQEWDYQDGIFLGQRLILVPRSGWSGGWVEYAVKDLSDPANPRIIGKFTAVGWIEALSSDSWAIGSCFFDDYSAAVMTGNISSSFQTVAVVSEPGLPASIGYGGTSPPYFIFHDKLWRVVDR